VEEDRDGVGLQDIADRLDKIIDLLQPAPAKAVRRDDGAQLVQEPDRGDDHPGGQQLRSG
jgi:hypothetical protein